MIQQRQHTDQQKEIIAMMQSPTYWGKRLDSMILTNAYNLGVIRATFGLHTVACSPMTRIFEKDLLIQKEVYAKKYRDILRAQ